MSRIVREMTLRRIPLDRGGYCKSTGQYFGIGAPVWNMRDPHCHLGVHHNFRAANVQNARVYVRSYMDHNHKVDVKFIR